MTAPLPPGPPDLAQNPLLQLILARADALRVGAGLPPQLPQPTMGPAVPPMSPGMVVSLMAQAERDRLMGMLSAGQNLPGVAGDASSALMTLASLLQGKWGDAGMNAIGILPFLVGGMAPLARSAQPDPRNVFRSLPGEATGDYLGRTAKHIYSDESLRREELRDVADAIFSRNEGRAAIVDDAGKIWTDPATGRHPQAAEIQRRTGATFSQPRPAFTGWVVDGKFYSTKDLDAVLADPALRTPAKKPR